jgi:hypothetical protein
MKNFAKVFGQTLLSVALIAVMATVASGIGIEEIRPEFIKLLKGKFGGDVDGRGATSSQFLQWNGTKWVPATAAAGGGESLAQTLAIGADANGVAITGVNSLTAKAATDMLLKAASGKVVKISNNSGTSVWSFDDGLLTNSVEAIIQAGPTANGQAAIYCDGFTLQTGGSARLAVGNTGEVTFGSLTKVFHNGASFFHIKTITSADSPYTVGAYDYALRVDASGGAVTVNLPAIVSAGNQGRQLVIKAVSVAGGNVTIARAGSDTIDGATSKVISTQYQSFTLHAPDAGADWAIE